MLHVKIEGSKITDWESFHTIFSETLGFPGYYGRNMDAWIDCMTYLDDPDSGMSKLTVKTGDYCLLDVQNIGEMKKSFPDAYDALLECSAFVNFRRIEKGDNPLLILSFYS